MAVLLVVFGLFVAAITGGLLLVNLRVREPVEPKTAAIVDQLSLSEPNPGFLASAARTLEQAGYLVDYYPADQVSVDLYRYLPTFDYDLIAFRVHVGTTRRVDPNTT